MKKVLDNKAKHTEEEAKIAELAEGKNEGDKIISENLLDDVDEDIIF